ncbi:hypothetical protein GUITHDRAFT_146121 [Guillardia theta CCMP2712]|uniref:Uncharacterized protein n=1 Tax=Guillardia theta (strain CCMP2712) TaxID=905079 RepID=L1IJI6_GUITC|nr:hypothetical protein GUITHDRAFT_146121 [Guillardia theta CCMP2712]EKX35975.1 hypothetical protein GUITHDRAFT_146121 [Guillardia theta CCMP2712]|eukprot:XP_005822955.1 hypothetical protein GUITHDRAFT_146121 [Guillardia theta CCMP2712]
MATPQTNIRTKDGEGGGGGEGREERALSLELKKLALPVIERFSRAIEYGVTVTESHGCAVMQRRQGGGAYVLSLGSLPTRLLARGVDVLSRPLRLMLEEAEEDDLLLSSRLSLCLLTAMSVLSLAPPLAELLLRETNVVWTLLALRQLRSHPLPPVQRLETAVAAALDSLMAVGCRMQATEEEEEEEEEREWLQSVHVLFASALEHAECVVVLEYEGMRRMLACHITSWYCRCILFLLPLAPRTDELSVLVLGLGGGFMPGWILTHLPSVRVHVVEREPLLLLLSRALFGLSEDERLSVSTGDAWEVLERWTEEAQTQTQAGIRSVVSCFSTFHTTALVQRLNSGLS